MFYKQLKRIVLILPFCVLISACSSIKYVSNNTLRDISLADSNISVKEKARKYGAIIIGKTNREQGKLDFTKYEHRVFILKTHKSRYIAETLLTDNSGEKKPTFDRSYFSFGADRKNKSFRMQIRFVY